MPTAKNKEGQQVKDWKVQEVTLTLKYETADLINELLRTTQLSKRHTRAWLESSDKFIESETNEQYLHDIGFDKAPNDPIDNKYLPCNVCQSETSNPTRSRCSCLSKESQ